ncbi:hypothetical protein [Candidatus Symbiopectobacterium sp.]|uniref:hypothetical protein n=1 Tax=Candidatus Symbiopectobacterium sp. TaxID=2816440 RepID=UPI0025C13B37|nr:hypothetical protein [Candidatus Symbiopectobacterium sp.]
MATFAITVFFHRRCLFTKRASYINFSHCIPHPKPDISQCNQHIEYTTGIIHFSPRTGNNDFAGL